MPTPYSGRHIGGAHRAPTACGARTSLEARLLPRTLRISLVFVAAIAALVGASAAGFASEARPQISTASFTASPMAVAQAAELSDNRNDTNAALAEARRSGVQRASALTQQQKTAASRQRHAARLSDAPRPTQHSCRFGCQRARRPAPLPSGWP